MINIYMKRIIVVLAAFAAFLAAFAQEKTPEMLKKKELFSKTELFEDPAIFSNLQANSDLISEYESNPSAFKDDQLLPLVSCYISLKNVDKAKELIEKYVKAVPSNMRAIRMQATISLISGSVDNAIELYKKAYAMGDKDSVKFLASAYIMSQKADEVTPYLGELKELAKGNLEALNICMLYALRDSKKNDDELIKEVLNNADYEKIMASATPDGMNTLLRIYIAKNSIWPAKAALIPGRGAIAAEAWTVAKQAYGKVLEKDPNNVDALKGMGVVEYRTGDVMRAAQNVKKALDLGDKEAVSDGMMLFVRSGDSRIYEMFSDAAKNAAIIPVVRAAMVQYSVNAGDKPEIFYMACIGEGSDLLYKDSVVRDLISEGLKKYGEDSRAGKVKSVLDSTKAESPAK